MSEATKQTDLQLASQQLIGEVSHLLDVGNSAAGLEKLAAYFQSTSQFDRLFEVRKMQSRLRLGVPVVYSSRPAHLDDETQRELEKDLAAAALDCGQKLASLGDIAGAWNYLRAVDDTLAVRAALEGSPLDEEGTHAAIDICLNHQAHPELGMKLAVSKLGTCTSITLFDSIHTMLAPEDLLAAAAVLVRHLYNEISTVAAQRLSQPAGTALSVMIEKNKIAVSHSSPHADPSHLSSVLRIGRTQTDPAVLKQLLTLSEYAELLPESLQYPGDAPFRAMATQHHLWYSALLGKRWEEAEAEFCKNLDRYGDSPDRIVSLEYGVLLLWSTARHSAAAHLATNKLALGDFEYGTANIAPHLIQMASHTTAVPIIADYYRLDGDVLGFALARLSHCSSSIR